LVVGFETVRNVSLSNSKCKKRTIRKRLKRQKKRGGKLPVDLVKLAKIAISPVLGKGLAEFEVALPLRKSLLWFTGGTVSLR
jgi:hypothetical protein